MTEEQRYDVVRTEPTYEVRRYHPHAVAEIEVDGTFESAGNSAFRPLVGYLGGRNVGGDSMAMTAPVIQRSDAPTALGAETTTESTGQGTFIVSFVLPADTDPSRAPVPTDERVHVRMVDEEYAAAARFSGRWTASSYAKRVAALVAALDADGLSAAGPTRFARFDPPWTPWFKRRNEVVIPLHAPAG
jgi:hypothetical protein